ncbi:MAG: hypothetical protein Q7R52_00920 [archaeon]|nr:hypothetical protein [archaeon]
MGIKTFFSKILGKREEPVIEAPVEIAPQKSEKQIYSERLKENVDIINDFFGNPQRYPGARLDTLEAKVTQDLYRKMLKAFKLLNSSANSGFRNVDDYYELKRIIQDIVASRDENVRYITPELKLKIDLLAKSMRYTAFELNKILLDKKNLVKMLEDKNYERNFFEYIIQFKQATDLIRKRIFG